MTHRYSMYSVWNQSFGRPEARRVVGSVLYCISVLCMLSVLFSNSAHELLPAFATSKTNAAQTLRLANVEARLTEGLKYLFKKLIPTRKTYIIPACLELNDASRNRLMQAHISLASWPRQPRVIDCPHGTARSSHIHIHCRLCLSAVPFPGFAA